MEHGCFDSEVWRSRDAGEMTRKGNWKFYFIALPAVSHPPRGSPRPSISSELHNAPPSQGVSVCVSRIVRRHYNHTYRHYN